MRQTAAFLPQVSPVLFLLRKIPFCLLLRTSHDKNSCPDLRNFRSILKAFLPFSVQISPVFPDILPERKIHVQQNLLSSKRQAFFPYFPYTGSVRIPDSILPLWPGFWFRQRRQNPPSEPGCYQVQTDSFASPAPVPFSDADCTVPFSLPQADADMDDRWIFRLRSDVPDGFSDCSDQLLLYFWYPIPEILPVLLFPEYFRKDRSADADSFRNFFFYVVLLRKHPVRYASHGCPQFSAHNLFLCLPCQSQDHAAADLKLPFS